MTMDTVFKAALRNELTALPSRERKSRRKRRVVGVLGLVGVLGAGSVAVANLPSAEEVVTMPIGAPMVVEGAGVSMVKFAPVPAEARYMRVELACFQSAVCGFDGQVGEEQSALPLVIERAALPVTDWYDPEDQQRLAKVDPRIGFTVKVDPGADWRLYAVYTEQLNPRSAQLPESNKYNPGSYVGIPNNIDFQEQMFIPVMASNGKLGWIGYTALMGAMPGTGKAPMPVFDIKVERTIGSIQLDN